MVRVSEKIGSGTDGDADYLLEQAHPRERERETEGGGG